MRSSPGAKFWKQKRPISQQQQCLEILKIVTNVVYLCCYKFYQLFHRKLHVHILSSELAGHTDTETAVLASQWARCSGLKTIQ